MDLNCTYEFVNKEPKLTVGQLFEAHCQLPANITVDLPKLKIKAPVDSEAAPTQKTYDVVFVKAAQGGEQLGMMLTSYAVGPHEISSLVLTDETQEYNIISPLRFEVQSILKPDEKPEMFGPISGVGVVIPLFYWVLLTSVIFLLIMSLGISTYRRIKRNRLLKRLESLEDGTLPLPQFFTSYRKLQRENATFNARTQIENDAVDEAKQSLDELLKIVKTVEGSLRIFLARLFRSTQYEQSWKKILSELEDNHDFLFSMVGNDLLELSKEFQKVDKGKNKLEPKDALLISEKTRKWVERADQLQAAILAKDTQLIKRLRGSK